MDSTDLERLWRSASRSRSQPFYRPHEYSAAAAWDDRMNDALEAMDGGNVVALQTARKS